MKTIAFISTLLLALSSFAATSLNTFFSNRAPIYLTIQAEFSKAFDEAFAGMPDGIIPPQRVQDPFNGLLSVDNNPTLQKLNITLKVRGNSSLQECSFPKLGFKLPTRSEYFGGLKNIKIGTHCSTDTTAGTIGRLRNEESAVREEVVYQLALALGIVVQKTRPAVIQYIETGATPSFLSPLTKKAFLLEDLDDVASELGGSAIKDTNSIMKDYAKLIDRSVLIRIHLLHTLTGNWDWSVLPNDHQLSFWNTDIISLANGQLLPVPKDFDLATFVTAKVPAGVNAKVEFEKAMTQNFIKNTSSFSKEELAPIIKEFISKKLSLYNVVKQSTVDKAGMTNALIHLDTFYKIISK